MTRYDLGHLLFPVTHCPSDSIVLVTAIVVVTLLSIDTISTSQYGAVGLRLDFLYHTVY